MRIARELIDPDADKVVRRLARHGFQAYLVGGCVRDLLLARTPKDFDVATNATPKEIRQLFRNCRIIGRRFRLAHIFFGPKIIETSTFRANPREGDEVEEGDEILIRRDNVFGTDTEDARRRDFTINGLFYDLEAERVIDHVGGLADLERRVVSTIGDPDIRFREDPVRMLRAVKFAARLGFEIEVKTLAALVRHRSEIAKCPQPRVLEELYRLLRGGAARRSLALLIDTGLAAILSPHLAALFGSPPPISEAEAAAAAAALAAAVAESRIRVSRPALPGASATRPRGGGGDEAAWAAVWADEEGEEAGGQGVPAEQTWPGADLDSSPAHDPALSHDHELEDVHDPDEEADVHAELHGLPPPSDDDLIEADDDDEADDAADDAAIAADADDAGAEEDDDDEAVTGELVAAELAAAEVEDDEDEEDEEDEDADHDQEGDEGMLLGRGTQPMASGAPSFSRSPEAMEQRRGMAWGMLDQLDIAFRHGAELSNSLLLSALCTPFLFEDLIENGVRPLEANDVVLEVLLPLVQQLQIARRDAERCRQILLAQRRLGPARRRRGKPMSLVRREFFRDALAIHHMMGQVGGFDVSDLTYWTKLHAQGEGGGAAPAGEDMRSGKKRRRRRGGRRRRRSPVGENQSGEWEPVAGG